MKIWVDADACPNAIKELLFRAARRRKVQLTMVANHLARVPDSNYIFSIQVPEGFNVADDQIVSLVQTGDLVVTADLPLAYYVVQKGAHAINPRGELYSEDNIRQRLTIRDLMSDLRSGGDQVGGPAPFGHKDRENFANQLDRFLTRNLS